MPGAHTMQLCTSLSNFATALYGNTAPRADDILSLTPTAVQVNLLKLIASRNPKLAAFLTAAAPVSVLALSWSKVFGGDVGSLDWLWTKLRSRFTATITVPHNHPLSQPVKKWMATQGMKSNARKVTLKKPEPSMQKGENDRDERPTKPDLLEVQPNEGKYFFRFEGNLLIFHIYGPEGETMSPSGKVVRFSTLPTSANSQVSISCLSVRAGMTPIQKFLRHIESLHAASQQSQTIVWRIDASNPDRQLAFERRDRPSRYLDSIAMADHVKIPLVKDIENYLSKETEIFYTSRGIPLRRGILLHGPPGTGKTSFSAAVAGHFDLDLFVINLAMPGLQGNDLEKLFDSLPFRCVVVIEDVDSTGITRENIREDTNQTALGSTAAKQPPKKSHITLSGLLNVIDGPCSQEGRLLIMTSNLPDSLDAALVRPGRIDRKIYLGNACTEVLCKLFKHIFARTDDDQVQTDRISAFSQAFSAAVEPEQFTPAEVQNYLMSHNNDPEAAVANAKQWAVELLAVKRSGKNVASPETAPKVADSTTKVESDNEKLTPCLVVKTSALDAEDEETFMDAQERFEDGKDVIAGAEEPAEDAVGVKAAEDVNKKKRKLSLESEQMSGDLQKLRKMLKVANWSGASGELPDSLRDLMGNLEDACDGSDLDSVDLDSDSGHDSPNPSAQCKNASKKASHSQWNASETQV